MTTCTHCEAETADGQYLCTPDRVTLYRILSRVRDTLETAGGTLTNQAVAPVNTGGGGGATVAGMPLNLTMLDRCHHYRDIIGSWSMLVAEATNQLSPVDVLNRAAWLAKQTETIARRDWAGDMLSELRAAERAVINAADRYGARRTLGTCGRLYLEDDGSVSICHGAIIGYEGQATAKCKGCGGDHDATELITDKVETTRHILLPLAACIRTMRKWGIEVNYNTAKSWARRDDLPGVYCTLKDQKTYYTPADVVATMRKMTTTNQRFGES